MTVTSVKTQVVNGTNYEATVKADKGSAVVTLYTKFGSNEATVTGVFPLMD